jgi:hypothetical protein
MKVICIFSNNSQLSPTYRMHAFTGRVERGKNRYTIQSIIDSGLKVCSKEPLAGQRGIYLYIDGNGNRSRIAQAVDKD